MTPVDTLEGRDATQTDIARFERWACVNLVKFYNTKRKVLHLGQGKMKSRLGRE